MVAKVRPEHRNGSKQHHSVRQHQQQQLSVHCKPFFVNFGFPEEIVTDNGPQFTAQTFSDFCKAKGIKHMFTPPYHPSSNGAADHSVQVVKQAIRKMGTSAVLKERLARFLLIYRSTPHATTGMRPDELFYAVDSEPVLHCCHQTYHQE